MKRKMNPPFVDLASVDLAKSTLAMAKVAPENSPRSRLPNVSLMSPAERFSWHEGERSEHVCSSAPAVRENVGDRVIDAGWRESLFASVTS